MAGAFLHSLLLPVSRIFKKSRSYSRRKRGASRRRRLRICPLKQSESAFGWRIKALPLALVAAPATGFADAGEKLAERLQGAHAALRAVARNCDSDFRRLGLVGALL
jgi:hypothetical protein